MPVPIYALRYTQGYKSTNSEGTKKQMRNRLARWAAVEKAREAHGPEIESGRTVISWCPSRPSDPEKRVRSDR